MLSSKRILLTDNNKSEKDLNSDSAFHELFMILAEVDPDLIEKNIDNEMRMKAAFRQIENGRYAGRHHCRRDQDGKIRIERKRRKEIEEGDGYGWRRE